MMDVLGQAHEIRDSSGRVFPSAHGKAMSDSTLSNLLRENGIPTTPHGVRSAFRIWAAECSDVPREIAEFALAHVEGSAAEPAYRRTDYFERRRGLMESWSDYLMVPRALPPLRSGHIHQPVWSATTGCNGMPFQLDSVAFRPGRCFTSLT